MRRAATAVILAVLAVAPAATAAPPAVKPPAASSMQDEPVAIGRAATPFRGSTTATPATDAAADVSHVVLALVAVVGLILGLRWAAQKLSLVPHAGKGGRGVRVLSRTVLSPKQQIMILQVGRRVLVVGDSGTAGMRPLCEIDDPDEVAALVGEVRSAEPAAPSGRSFASLFRRAEEPFAGDCTGPTLPGAPEPEVPGEVAGLLDKVRGLRQQFDR